MERLFKLEQAGTMSEGSMNATQGYAPWLNLLYWVSDLDYFNWLVWLFTPVVASAVVYLLCRQRKRCVLGITSPGISCLFTTNFRCDYEVHSGACFRKGS